jgi:hypothetical protein
VTIYEQSNECGGRVKSVNFEEFEGFLKEKTDLRHMEIGGSFFIDANKYVKHFVNQSELH